jgi:Do/DeqQ family serine protease
MKFLLMKGFIFLTVSMASVFCPYGHAVEDATSPYPRETPVVRAVKKISPAVVNISSEYEVRNRVNPFFQFPVDPFFKDFFDHRYERRQKLSSLGSGVIIDGRRGFILTNEHVIAKTGTITVVLNDGREFKADIVGADPESDLAVLKISSEAALPSIEMGDSNDIMIGETVIAIGNPFGFSNTVTTGVVSAVNRSIRVDERVYNDFIQTDASINPGNSGGPLLNINGELIGINTAIYAKAEGIGFAIPINKARKIITDLIEFGEVVHAWIGLSVQNIDARLAQYMNLPSAGGVVAQDIEPSGPAAASGVLEGDVILSIDQQRIESIADYEQIMRGLPSGKNIEIKLKRDGREMVVGIKTTIFPEALALKLAYRQLGVKVEDIPDKKKTSSRIPAGEGVLISDIDPNSDLARIGVKPGDAIRQINDADILNLEDFKKAVIKYRWKESLVVLIQRGGQGYYITVKIEFAG